MRAWVLMGFLWGCSSSATVLVVEVTTDFEVPAEIDLVRFEITGPSGATDLIEQSLRAVDSPSFPLTLSLVPGSAQGLGPVSVSVIGEQDNRQLIEQTRVTSMVDGETRRLSIHLSRSCLNAPPCDDAETCHRGECEPQEVPSSPWSGPSQTDAGSPAEDAMAPDANMMDAEPLDAEPADATTDSAAPDANHRDAGDLDAGVLDAASDSGPADAGMDTGPADTGPADTGPADTGPADTGPADAGPADTGQPDSGPLNSTVTLNRTGTFGTGSVTCTDNMMTCMVNNMNPMCTIECPIGSELRAQCSSFGIGSTTVNEIDDWSCTLVTFTERCTGTVSAPATDITCAISIGG